MESNTNLALINPSILIWARSLNGLKIEVVSKTFPKIQRWEEGILKPTIEEARQLARFYDQPFALFYLSKPINTVKITRVLRWYEKKGDAFVGEHVLDLNLNWLQKLFGESKDALMLECYPVSRSQARRLSKKANCVINFDSYAYFLEAFGD